MCSNAKEKVCSRSSNLTGLLLPYTTFPEHLCQIFLKLTIALQSRISDMQITFDQRMQSIITSVAIGIHIVVVSKEVLLNVCSVTPRRSNMLL